MVIFKHKNGGIAKVYTKSGIERLRADKNYTEVSKIKSKKVVKPIEDNSTQEVEEVQPLQ